ncbi:MAG TPA: XisI protein [Nostocaceae cyanobacterium]|nr:XisI protein [Nostocaceae cyanobacterium]
MADIEYYRQCIESILTENSSYKPKYEELEKELIFDRIHDHYLLMRVGWNGSNRIYHTVMHFDIKDGKIWIQENRTDTDVGEELVKMGIPKEDIILGLHPPYKRPYTDYGVA